VGELFTFETTVPLLGVVGRGVRFICKGLTVEDEDGNESVSEIAVRLDGNGGWRDILNRCGRRSSSAPSESMREEARLLCKTLANCGNAPHYARRDGDCSFFSCTLLRATGYIMLHLGNSQINPFSVESSLTPEPSSVVDMSSINNARRAAAYIEPPPLAPAERIKYEALSDRDLPQDFDFGLPLSDRVIIGEYWDGPILWYYVENTDGLAHRVSVLLTVLMLAGSNSSLLHSMILV